MCKERPIGKSRFAYGKNVRRKRFLLAAAALALVAVGASALSRLPGNPETGGRRQDRSELLRLWEAGAFGEVHRLTGEALATRPLDYFLLTMRGFSAYQLGVSQVDSRAAGDFFGDSVRALRQAALLREAEGDGRVFYVLGKAYFNKGDGFADLAVRYLERAREMGHEASDIPEILGLAHAAIGDYRASVVAFSQALQATRPSALLLFHIAGSYVALGELEKARAYLTRGVAVSVDSRTTVRARLFLAEVLRMMGDVEGAMAQIAGVIEDAGENADARFQLGEIYASLGNNVRARAEWRRARDIDPAHARANARLSS